MSKLSRSEAIVVAQAARKLPDGVVSDRVHLQLSTKAAARVRKQNSQERGATYEMGANFEADGYLLIYDILDQLGSPVISTIIDTPMMMICRHKTYEGDNQAQLLLEILRDRLENFNHLTPGGLDDERRISD